MKWVEVDFDAQLDGDYVRLDTKCSLRDIGKEDVQIGDDILVHDGELGYRAIVELTPGGPFVARLWGVLYEVGAV